MDVDISLSSPPPPPPRRRTRYFPLELLPAVMAFCDLTTVARSCLACKHWNEECSSYRVWYQLAIGSEPPAHPHPTTTRSLSLDELKRAAALRHQLMQRRAVSRVAPGRATDSRERNREFAGSHHQQRGVGAERHEKFSTSIGRFDPTRKAVTRASQWQHQAVTVREAIDDAASAYVADRSRLRTAAAANQGASAVEVVERIHQVLTERASRAAVAAADMARTFEGKAAALNATIRIHVDKQSQEVRDQAADVFSLRSQADGAIERASVQRAITGAAHAVLTSMKRFESIVVRLVLQHHQPTVDSSPASAVHRAPAITDFAALELYLLSKPRYGSPMWVQWTQVKRSVPIDDIYYDLKDMAANAEDDAVITIRDCCRTSREEAVKQADPKCAVWSRIVGLLAKYEEQCASGGTSLWSATQMMKVLNTTVAA